MGVPKYKVFVGVDGKVYDVASIVFEDGEIEEIVIVWNDGVQGDRYIPKKPDDCVLMQYTGLLDKNGGEIYDGYIIRATARDAGESPAEVVLAVGYDDEDGCYYASTLSNVSGVRYTFVELKGWEMEVIGNVWQNGSLMLGHEQKIKGKTKKENFQ